MAVCFKGKMSSIDTINYGTMSDDEEVTSDVPPRYLFNATTQEVVSVRPSGRPSVGPSRVIFERQIWPFFRVKFHQITF